MSVTGADLVINQQALLGFTKNPSLQESKYVWINNVTKSYRMWDRSVCLEKIPASKLKLQSISTTKTRRGSSADDRPSTD